jgi:WD40 repeat protein
VTAVLLVVGLGVGLGLGLGRDDGTPTVTQPPPTPTLTRPAPVPSTATGKVVRTLAGPQPTEPAGYGVGITPDRSTVYFSAAGPEGCRQRGIYMVPLGGGPAVRVVADDNAIGLIRFSADGSRMAYTSMPCPDTGEPGDIVVRQADGPLVRRWQAPSAASGITTGQVSLSPDGRQVAVPAVLVLDPLGVRVLDVARTNTFYNGRFVPAPDARCQLTAADFQPRTGRLAAFERCLDGPPSHLRLVYLDPVSDAVASRSFSFVNTGGDLHVSSMDFDSSGHHLLYLVSSGAQVEGTGTWRSRDGGRPVRVHDATSAAPSW